MKARRIVRKGLSLLEVLLAMAIFLIALVGIFQLMNLATDLAMETQHLNRATQLLQTKMNEVVAGAVPLTGSGESTFDEDPNWSWQVQAESDSTPNLYRVTVTVTLKEGSRVLDSWTMSQLVLDPAARGMIETPPSVSSGSSSGSGSPSPMTPGGP